MTLRNKLTTEGFRSRCARCPERGLGACLLAQALLGEDYTADNCKGPILQPRPGRPNILGLLSDDLIAIGSVMRLKLVCRQDPNVIPGEVVDNGVIAGEIDNGPPPPVPGPPEITSS